MAESCIFGPGANCHIRCPDWDEDVTLFRVGEELFCRKPSGGMVIDGAAATDRGRVTRRSQISATEFSMSLEPIV
jgi:hypothetical protein